MAEKYTQIEQYIMDWLYKKYASRVISKLNTEWENYLSQGKTPGVSEFKYMKKRALEIHREVFDVEEEKSTDEKEAADSVGTGSGQPA